MTEPSGGASLEEGVTGIWQEVFGLAGSEADRGVSLFEMGGTSLQAVRLRTRISEVFGVNVELWDIFADGSIKDLVRLVTEAQAQARSAGGADEAEIHELLSEIEEISDEEALRLLEGGPSADGPRHVADK